MMPSEHPCTIHLRETFLSTLLGCLLQWEGGSLGGYEVRLARLVPGAWVTSTGCVFSFVLCFYDSKKSRAKKVTLEAVCCFNCSFNCARVKANALFL